MRKFLTILFLIPVSFCFPQNVSINDDSSLNPGTSATDGVLQLMKKNNPYNSNNYSVLDLHTYQPLAANITSELAFKTGTASIYFTGLIKTIGFDASSARMGFFTGASTDRTTTLTERLTLLNNGNVGIGVTNPSAFFSVGSGSKFQIDNNGNITKINNVICSWPSSQGGANQVLANNGSGTFSWVNPGSLLTAGTGISISGNTINSLWNRTGTKLYPATANDYVEVVSNNGSFAISGKYNSNIYGNLGGSTYGCYGQYDSEHWGAFGGLSEGLHVENNGSNADEFGGIFSVVGGVNNTYGIYSKAYGAAVNYGGLFGAGDGAKSVKAGSTNIGIYSSAAGGSVNWSGYFMDSDVALANASNTATRIVFFEPSFSGSNYTAFKAQAQANDIVYTLPAADGANGQVLKTNGAGTLSWQPDNPSDSRFKKNIRPLANSLDRVMLLEGYNFEYLDTNYNGSGIKMGFMAQQALEIVPEAVNRDNNGYYSMDYASLTALLVEAIKEQQKIIDELRKRIENCSDLTLENHTEK